MHKALLWKIGLIFLVGLLLQLPLESVRSLVAERKSLRDGVVAEIGRSASEAQKIAGPVLYVPWTRRSVESTTITDDSGHTRTARKERVERGHIALLPHTLAIDGAIELQEKHRGLYKAHLYTLRGTLEGSFTLPPALGVSPGAGTLEWGRAQLVLGVSDTRGIREPVLVEWNGAEAQVDPGGLEAAALPSGVHADLGALAATSAKASTVNKFKISLTVLGTERLDLVPVGATTSVALASTWPHPSFAGRLLPDAGTRVGKDGFAARWRTSHFATNLAQVYERCLQSRQCEPFVNHTLAVSFFQPVDLYHTVERSLKYGFLFIGLTFAAFFLFEILKRLAIHPLQYALVGCALAVFFLLLISLSEHLGFSSAYAIAAGACVTLLGYYVRHMLKSARLGAAFATALALLYGLLYVLLRSEDHALTMGSLLVFACLATAMIATRKVDWYAVGAPAPQGKAA